LRRTASRTTSTQSYGRSASPPTGATYRLASSSRHIDASDFSLATSNGVRFVNLSGTTQSQNYATGRGLSSVGTTVDPGATMSTALLFVIPFDGGRFTLRFAPTRATIEIDECHCNLPSPVRTVG